MTTLTNSAEGGTSGNAVTAGTSGGASGSAFDVVTIGTNATDAFDNTHAAHGSLSYKIATGASSVTVFNRWSTSFGSSVSQSWWRIYLYMTANPSATERILLFSTSGGTTCGNIAVNTNGTVSFLNATSSTIITTSVSFPVNINGWTRLEGYVIGSATVGQAEIKIFLTPDSATADNTQTSAANVNTTGAMGLWSYGIVNAAINWPALWMDDLGLSDAGYIGPASNPGTNAPAALAASTGVPPSGSETAIQLGMTIRGS